MNGQSTFQRPATCTLLPLNKKSHVCITMLVHIPVNTQLSHMYDSYHQYADISYLLEYMPVTSMKITNLTASSQYVVHACRYTSM